MKTIIDSVFASLGSTGSAVATQNVVKATLLNDLTSMETGITGTPSIWITQLDALREALENGVGASNPFQGKQACRQFCRG